MQRHVLSENRNTVDGFYHMKFHSIGIVAILGACLLRKLVNIIFFIYLFYFKESGKNYDCTTKGFSYFDLEFKIELPVCLQSQ